MSSTRNSEREARVKAGKARPAEQALYVPRHRRQQQQQQQEQEPRDGDVADLATGLDTLSVAESHPRRRRRASTSAAPPQANGTNGGVPDRRTLILSFIENAGKDDAVVSASADEWERHLADSDSDDVVSPPSLSAPSSPMRATGPHANVLEVHGFSSELTTAQLKALLSTYQSNLDIRWVDDTRALAVFRSVDIAMTAYADQHKLPLQLALYSNASAAAKRKFERTQQRINASDTRVRPVTSTAVANRLVSGALGIRVQRTPAQIEADRLKMQAERERRQAMKATALQESRAMDSAWDD